MQILFLRQFNQLIRLLTRRSERLFHNNMLSSLQSFLRKLEVRSRRTTYIHDLDVRIGKKVFDGAVVLRVREVDGAVHAWLGVGGILGRGGALEEGVDLDVWVGEDVGEVVYFGGAGVAYHS